MNLHRELLDLPGVVVPRGANPRIASGWSLRELLRASNVAAELRGDGTAEIRALAYDSRRVSDGTLFFCFAGEKTDGHDFAPAAVEAGAGALVVERPLDLDVPQAQVEDARAAMAPIAAAFHGDPTSELTVVGITGTNGKTTTAFLVRHLLDSAGTPCGLLGTVQQLVGGQVEEVERTTPEAIDLQRTFSRMLEGGDEACAMEVSSHALVLHRADAIHFAVKVFTNLSQDHLDFHADMEDYFAAKRLLFAGEGGAPLIELEGGVSVLNADDPYGRRLADELSGGPKGDCVTYSAAGDDADLRAGDVSFDTAVRASSASPPRVRSRSRRRCPETSTSPTPWRPSRSPTPSASTSVSPRGRSPRRGRCRAGSSRSTRGSPSA